jgi:hypothetical protein
MSRDAITLTLLCLLSTFGLHRAIATERETDWIFAGLYLLLTIWSAVDVFR